MDFFDNQKMGCSFNLWKVGCQSGKGYQERSPKVAMKPDWIGFTPMLHARSTLHLSVSSRVADDDRTTAYDLDFGLHSSAMNLTAIWDNQKNVTIQGSFWEINPGIPKQFLVSVP